MDNGELNFDVDISSTAIDEDTVLVTSTEDADSIIERKTMDILLSEINAYDQTKNHSSVFTSEEANGNALTVDYIDTLATGINSNLTNVVAANQLILKLLNTNSLFGLAYSILLSTINTSYHCQYDNPFQVDIGDDEMSEIKDLINAFNKTVELDELIRIAVSTAFTEGNYPMCLRLDKTKAPVIQSFPLSICYPSYYMNGTSRIMEMNIQDMKNRIRKTYSKTKKNKAIYYENEKREIEDNYPKEVYDGFVSGEKIIRMDPRYCKCLTINSFGRRFGVSPFFRALKSAAVLENIVKSDISYSKAKSKIIIFQKLSDKLMGQDGTRRALPEQQLAHREAASALQTSSCLYTAPAFVESLEYITPKSNNTDEVDLLKQYTTQLLTALGISFLDVEASNGTHVTISFKGLLRIVNSISASLAKIISQFYGELLEFYGYDRRLAPSLQIETAEELDLKTRMELSEYLYTKLNISAETAMKYVGVDVKDEVAKRSVENDNNLSEIFKPRPTAYNYSADGDVGAGRPAGSDDSKVGKQQYDNNRNGNAAITEEP